MVFTKAGEPRSNLCVDSAQACPPRFGYVTGKQEKESRREGPGTIPMLVAQPKSVSHKDTEEKLNCMPSKIN